MSAGLFRFRAAASDGTLSEGVVEAATHREALELLRRRALWPVSLEPTAGREPTREWLSVQSRTRALSSAVRSLATLAGAGIPLERALDFVVRNTKHARVRAALAGVLAEVRSGSALSDAVAARPLFGPLAAPLLRAGEESGTLEQGLEGLAQHYERSSTVRAELLTALVYPTLVLGVATLSVALLLLVVVPRFAAMLQEVGATLPLATRMLLALSGLASSLWPIILVLTAILGTATWSWLRAPENRLRWHSWRLSLPLLGDLERTLSVAQLAAAIGTLLRGGTALLPALRIGGQTVPNLAIRQRIKQSIALLDGGARIGEALRGVLPPLALQLVAAGEESGSLDRMFALIAERQREEAERTLRVLVRLVEPLLIVLLGLVVGFVALAMLQAIYRINAGLT